MDGNQSFKCVRGIVELAVDEKMVFLVEWWWCGVVWILNYLFYIEDCHT